MFDAVRNNAWAMTLCVSLLASTASAQPQPPHAAAAAPTAKPTPSFAASLSIRADKPGPKIDRNVYGSFAEHLGRGIYEGIWVGEGSPIPNTRGIRNDVVAALRKLQLPLLRWPGGCFAD